MTTWVLVMYMITGLGAPMQPPTLVDMASEKACRAAAAVAIADARRGFSVAMCLDTGFPANVP